MRPIHFTKESVQSLYLQYAKSSFSSALRKLLEEGALAQEQKSIASLAMNGSKAYPTLFAKSYVIFLSNGVIESTSAKARDTSRDQLFLDLGLRILSFNLAETIRLPLLPGKMFSLELNCPIPSCPTIKKNGQEYVFDCGSEEKTCSKNEECVITQDIDFLEQDKNPFNANNDHPDAPSFVPYDLGGVPREKWVDQFRNAYEIIKREVPLIYDEVYPFLDAIVPHGYQQNKQMSSSYSKSPGILYLSYVENDDIQAEAIIHEVHHTIFNIISWKYPLYRNGDELQYYSAYRPDARHIRGCFLGLHAFVAVQNFYRALSLKTPSKKNVDTFLMFYLKNRMVISVLEKYADFTPEGRMLFEDICQKFQSDAGFFEGCQTTHADNFKEIGEKVVSHLEQSKASNSVLLY